MSSRRARLAVVLMALGLLTIGITATPSASAATLGRVGASGTSITVGGVPISTSFVGFDDTTILAYAVRAFISGITSDAGKNMNFPVPDVGKLTVSTVDQLWSSFFDCAHHYGFNLVRISNGDAWSTRISYDAWVNHTAAFYAILDSMCHWAEESGVWVCLNLVGTQGYPFYAFGGTGSVLDLSKASGTAYNHYLSFLQGVMAHLESSDAIFSFDVWNEPDCDTVNTQYWHGDTHAFHVWASQVANDTTPLSTHLVEMGVGAGGYLCGHNEADFDAVTGDVGFDLCHCHVYGWAEDEYLITDRLSWAEDAGKPLHVGELANNSVYPLVRWGWWESTFADDGGQAFCSMVVRGTPGYPLSISVSASGQTVTEGDTLDLLPVTTLERNAWSLGTDSGASIDASTGRVTWTTDLYDAGTYYLEITASNPAGTGTITVPLTVNDVPVSPSHPEHSHHAVGERPSHGGGGGGGGGVVGSGSHLVRNAVLAGAAVLALAIAALALSNGSQGKKGRSRQGRRRR